MWGAYIGGVTVFSWVKIRDGHDNFFTPMRLFFAILVVIGHAFVVAGGDPIFEPRIFLDYTPSYIAVNLFFIASGFLVTKSMLFREDITEYSSARILRIFPALFIHILFVMFIIGPWVTNLPLKDFLTDPALLAQPFLVLSFFETNMVMPGAFETNHEQLGSAALWTLRYEVLAYIGTAIAFSLGLLKRNWMILGQFIAFALLWPIAHLTGLYDKVPGTVQAILRFGLCYGLGAAAFAYQDKLKFHILGVPLLALATFAVGGTIAAEIMLALLLGYIVFWMSYVKIPALNPLKKLEDTSYGIYIYHWVILQTLAYFMPWTNEVQLILFGLPISMVLALASWRLIEKPMLKRKKSFAQSLSGIFGKRAKTVDIFPACLLYTSDAADD